MKDKPISIDKSNVTESLPEKVIEKKFVLSEKGTVPKSVNYKKGAKNKRDPAGPKKDIWPNFLSETKKSNIFPFLCEGIIP